MGTYQSVFGAIFLHSNIILLKYVIPYSGDRGNRKKPQGEPVAFSICANIILAITVEDGVFNKYIVYFANCL